MKEGFYTIKDLQQNTETIASSNWKYYPEAKESAMTSLIKDKLTGKYYLFDKFSTPYNKEDEIELRKININLDNKSLNIIFRNLEGIINEEEILEFIDLQSKLKKIMS